MQEMFYMCQKSEVQVKNGNVKLLKWLISFQLCSKMLGKKKLFLLHLLAGPVKYIEIVSNEECVLSLIMLKY